MDSYRLTDAQYAMLADSLTVRGYGLWNVQLTFTIREPLDVRRFERAWQQLVDRHPALRTRFVFSEGSAPVQHVEDGVRVSVDERDWTGRAPGRVEADVEALRKESLVSDLDFSAAPLMRVILVRARPELCYCIWVGHHALVDGRSMHQMARELPVLYHEGDDRALPAARPFREYVDWLDRHRPEGASAFWRQHLDGITRATSLGWPPPGTGPGPLGSESLRLSRPQTAALAAFGARQAVTANAVLQAAWALLLQRYSGEDDVLFGSTRACRGGVLGETDGADHMVGPLAHAVPVRVRFTPSLTVAELVREVSRQHVALGPFEHTFSLAVRKATSVPAGSRLFETVVTFDEASLPAALRSLGGSWPRWDVRDGARNGYAVTVSGCDEPELRLRIEWHGAWIADAVASRMLRHLAHVLVAMIETADRPALEVECLPDEDRTRLVHDWNRTDVPYPVGETLPGLVAAQAARTPARAAVRLGDETLTYAELSRRARRLAAALQAQGVARGSIVGVCLERSFELIVALLAVLGAGAAYLPVEPELPVERKAFLLDDAGAQVVLITRELSREWAPAGVTLVMVGAEGPEGEDPPPLADPGVTAAAAAYVIYTSGSTGRPKGAINSHRGIVNRLRWMQDRYALTDRDRVLQKTPIGFDVSVWELFWPLITGAELVLARPRGHKDARYLVEVIAESAITVAHFVPSMLTDFLNAPDARRCHTLRLVACSGEALPVDVQDRFLSVLGARLENLYGPTEAAVDVTYWRCRKEPGQTTVPIGRPAANTRLYVLDPRRRLTPIGMPGELYIGGVQVADGYVNRPELTASRFVPDPFAADPSARLYRTGDLVRYREDGVIEFLGRNDEQFKVRGFRIEPEEIEAAIRTHEAVRDAAVVVRHVEGDRVRLIAFVAFTGPDIPTTSDLRRFLRRWLPDHMIPGMVVEVAELPRLPSGKIDRGALRTQADASLRPSGPSRELRTPVEKAVASVWKTLLKVAEVGPRDNFFELGGDSLLAVEAALALEDTCGRRIDPRLMFFQTLEQIAASLDVPPSDATAEPEAAGGMTSPRRRG